MPAELFALAAAFAYASAHTLVKLGQRPGNMILGFLVTLGTGTVALGVLALLTVEVWSIPVLPVVLFALAGVAGPGIGRLLAMRSVRDVGTTVAVPVKESSNPVIATAAAAFVFNEAVGIGRVLALALVVAGIWSCIRGGSANREGIAELQGGPRPGALRLSVLLLPLSAGAAYAGSDILRKFALEQHGDAVLGTFLGMLTAFVIWLVIFAAAPALRRGARVSRSLRWFFLSGLMSATAQLLLMFALRSGDLSVVAPIVSSQPVIVIFLGAVLLKDFEKLRLGTVVGGILVFLGIAYLSVA